MLASAAAVETWILWIGQSYMHAFISREQGHKQECYAALLLSRLLSCVANAHGNAIGHWHVCAMFDVSA